MAAGVAAREKLVELICTLLEKKPSVADVLGNHIKAGKSILVKGVSVSVDVLKEALAKHTAAGLSVGGNNSSASIATPTQPSLSAEGQKAPGQQRSTPIAVTVPAAKTQVQPVSSAGQQKLPEQQMPETRGGSDRATELTSATQPQQNVGLRWSAPATSASTLASLVTRECEDAELISRRVVVAGSNKVAVLARPNSQGTPTGEYLSAGEEADVIARAVSAKDGRVYLRLKLKTGWVSIRSRKDFSKVVISSTDGAGQPLEPPSAGASLPSRAMLLLPRVDEEGKAILAADPSAGAPDLVAKEPVKFQAGSSRSQILSHPHCRGGNTMHGAMLTAGEAFMANAVHFNAPEGRAYLRLGDGRGWVGERAKHQFSKFAVDPVDRAALGIEFEGTFDGEGQTHAASVSSSMLERARARLGGAGAAREVAGIKHLEAQLRLKEEQPPAGPTAQERAEERRKTSAEPSLFRSDCDLWPKSMGDPRPVVSDTRRRLRKLSLDYGPRLRKLDEDIQDATERADSYARACPGSKALRDQADALQKQAAKVQKEWAKAVDDVVAKAEPGATGHAPPLTPARGDAEGNVEPCQVRGGRWYCAALKAEVVASSCGDEGGVQALQKRYEELYGSAARGPCKWKVEWLKQKIQQKAGETGDGDKVESNEGEGEGEVQGLQKRYEELYGSAPRGPMKNKAEWLQQKIKDKEEGDEEDGTGDPARAPVSTCRMLGPLRCTAAEAAVDLKRLREAAGLPADLPDEKRRRAASAGA